MPALEQMDLTDDAMLWLSTGMAPDGEPAYPADPTPIKVRWVDTIRVSPQGGPEESQAADAVALIISAQRLPDKALLWRGTEDEWAAALNDNAVDGLRQVSRSTMTKSIKGRHVRYEADVVRYKGQAPGET